MMCGTRKMIGGAGHSKKNTNAVVKGRWNRGRPRLRWEDDVISWC